MMPLLASLSLRLLPLGMLPLALPLLLLFYPHHADETLCIGDDKKTKTATHIAAASVAASSPVVDGCVDI
jgi:hypothetical protein